MSFNPFLRQLAAHYVTMPVEELARISFVFPNNRSAYFFKDYFNEEFKAAGRQNLISPQMTTLSSLVEEWCGMIEAERMDLLLLLYSTYIDLIANEYADRVTPALEPDRFLFWCEVVLNDFDEIDHSLVDASHLYRNLHDLKELQTNPLSPEQIELIKQFWKTTGVPWIDEYNESQRMWVNEEPSESHKASRNFLHLWELLGPLYDAFQQRLEKEGLCYIGMAYRRTVDRLRRMIDEGRSTGKSHYVFIGFSSLSNAEQEIFSILKEAGIADFHWDTNLPRLGVENDFPLRLVEDYRRRFPEPEGFEIQPSDYEPEITVYSVPTEIGQVMLAANILKDSGLTPETATRHAVVLPEQSLCIPLLNSLNLTEGIDTNITMGYPMRETSMAALMGLVAEAVVGSRVSGSKVELRKAAVVNLLSNPLLMSVKAPDCGTLLAILASERRIFVPVEGLKELAPGLKFLLDLPASDDVDEILAYMERVATTLRDAMQPTVKAEDQPQERSVEKEYLDAYILYLNLFGRLVEKYGLQPAIVHGAKTAFEAIQKMIGRLSMTFVGLPLKGIQVMGILETRALDFENVIITSMNEQVFPRKLQKPTFIPQTLRAAYLMPKREDEETVMAYHFYRLIGRARKVHLLYNNDSEGLRSGEMSRYIYQLYFLYKPAHLKDVTMTYEPWVVARKPIEVTKTHTVMEQLKEYQPNADGSLNRTLSASSIKTLLSCPLHFYLANVCRLSADEEDVSHIGDSVYGKIVHNVMENVYDTFPKADFRGEEYPKVTPEGIDRLLSGNAVSRLSVQAINREHFGLADDALDSPLDGEATVIYEAVVNSVRAMLRAERDYLREHGKPFFLFVKAEVNQKTVLKLSDDLSVGLTYIIDRVDRMFNSHEPGDNYLRIVDYKTGRDVLEFGKVADLVDYSTFTKDKQAPKAITQLMIYSLAYVDDPVNGVDKDEVIQPLIYKFADVTKFGGKINHLAQKMNREKHDVMDYHEISEEFMELLSDRLRELFDPAKPIKQAVNTKECEYCRFKEICGR